MNGLQDKITRVIKSLDLGHVFFEVGDVIEENVEQNINNYTYHQGFQGIDGLDGATVNFMRQLGSVQKTIKVDSKRKLKEFDIPIVKDFQSFRVELLKGNISVVSIILAFVPSTFVFNNMIPPAFMNNAASISAAADRYDFYSKTADDLEKKLNNLISQSDSFIANSTKQVSTLEETYSNKLKLSAPSSYVEEKARAHKNTAIVFGLLSACIILVPFVIMYCVGNEKIVSGINSIDEKRIYVFGIIAVSAIGGIAWIVRISSRVFIQNMNLWADASQRSVLVKVFLALQVEGGINAKAEERILVLNALFRPIGEGKDEDLSPPSLTDFITKART